MSEEQLLANIFRILQESWEREIDPLKSEIEKIKSCMNEIKEYIAIQKSENQKNKEILLTPLIVKMAILSGVITLLVNILLKYLPI
jgi:DNA-binding transcriptional regulator GbsR (MarR family)